MHHMPSVQDLLDDFEPWIRLSERPTLPKEVLGSPGVYMLARFEQKRKQCAQKKILKEILYIGESCSQSIDKRLKQFQRSATKGKKAHSGGLRFHKKYPPRKMPPYEKFPDWLYVSFLTPNMEEPFKSTYIRFVERSLLWAYVDEHKCLPECNFK